MKLTDLLRTFWHLLICFPVTSASFFKTASLPSLNDHVGVYLTSKNLIYNVKTVGIQTFSSPSFSRVQAEYGDTTINARAQSKYGKVLTRKTLYSYIFFK